MIVLYLVIFGVITSLRHHNFQTQTWDLAAFDQSFWNAAHGRGLVNNLEQVRNHLGLHMSPLLFALVPGYALFDSPYFLLIIQTLALAIGAWPLYLLAQKVLGKNGPWALLIAGAYLLYPGLQWTNMYDFHEAAFFVPLLLSAIYFLEVKKWGWATLFLILSAGVKEDAILMVIFVGIYLIVRRATYSEPRRTKDGSLSSWWTTERKIGITTVILALIYFILAVKIIMPALGGGVLRFDRYANLGATPAAIISNVAANPLLLFKTIITGPKLAYVFWLFLPMAFLPILSWRALILIVPGLLENLLTNYQFQFSGLYHYDAILIPGIFLGTIYGLQTVLNRWPAKEKLVKAVLAGGIALAFVLRSPISPLSFPIQYLKSTPQWEAYRQLVKLVPDGISVAANTHLVPHLTHREHVHAIGSETSLADMVIVDAADLFGFDTPENMQAYIDNYMKTGLYTIKVFDNRYVILLNNRFKLVPNN